MYEAFPPKSLAAAVLCARFVIFLRKLVAYAGWTFLLVCHPTESMPLFRTGRSGSRYLSDINTNPRKRIDHYEDEFPPELDARGVDNRQCGLSFRLRGNE